MLNSYNQFCDVKQTDKIVFDFTTRLFFLKVQMILIKLFNKANKAMKEAHKSK